MFRTVVRSLHRDRHRFVLPALAVLIGVACVSGSLLYTQAQSRAAALLQRASRPDVSVEVRPVDPGGPGPGEAAAAPDEALRGRLSALPGVAAARGTSQGTAFLVARDGTLVGQASAAAGVDFVPDRRGADPRYPLTSGHGPHGPAEVAVDESAARRGGYRVGDRVRIVVAGEVRSARLTGVFTVHDPRVAAGGTLVAFDRPTALDLFAPAPGQYRSVTLTAGTGTSAAALAERVARVLPHGLEAVPRAQLDAEAAAAPDRKKLGTLLLLFAGIALFVSAFLVGNTFTMLSAVRAREHALLRVVGASRGRVLRTVLGEAVLLGALAATAGYAVGVGVAAVLTRLFAPSAGAAVPAAPDVFSPLPMLTALGVGVGLAAAAAYVPALRASAVAPIAALRTELPAAAGKSTRRDLAGLGATGAGALLLAAGGDLAVLALALPVLLAGLILLTPRIAQLLGGALRGPLRRLAGVRGTLALANVCRNPRRTAATAGALTVCAALVSAVAVALSSLGATAGRDAEAAMPTDLRITAVDFAEIGADTAAKVARLPHVAAVSSVREAGFRLPGDSALWTAVVDPDAVGKGRLADLTVHAGSLDDLSRGIAVTRDLAAEHGWRLGDLVTGEELTDEGAPDGRRLRRRVVAIYDGPEVLGPALLPESAVTGAGPAGGGQVTSVLVRSAPGHTPDLKEEIRRALHNPVLLVQDRADAGRDASAGYGPLLSVLYAMLSVTAVIAALGVANTMGMAVFERTREIGLLRAVGLDRAGVRSLLRLESVVVSSLGSGLGILAGGAAGAAAVAGQGGAVISVPWASLLVVFAGAGAVGVLAALGPGVRAAAVPVPQAVGGEVG
ncbi:FtsX-like permease family protein [Streptomyces sp. MMS24-I2-30]|uniref:FtsX-like permease family protein n=1 Tax=Streptomyces sp. MMS24-I2-30 TaxID=3351564 RepID=UPI0038969FA4